MAYRIENNNPFDTNYKLAVGVSVPFVGSTISGSDAVFNSTYTTTDQIRSNLINFMLTNKGERPLNPNYGSDLRRYVFSNITEDSLGTNIGIQDLKNNLLSEVRTNFPEINVISLEITPSIDTNTVNINLTYSFFGGQLNTVDITI
jgi:phage baseplate assembly protein W